MVVFTVDGTTVLTMHFLFSFNELARNGHADCGGAERISTSVEAAADGLRAFVLAYRNRFTRRRRLPENRPSVTQFMPCYGCHLRHIPEIFPISLSNIFRAACHGKTLRIANISAFVLSMGISALLPQFSRAEGAQDAAATTSAIPTSPSSIAAGTPGAAAAPGREDEPPIERPDFSVHVARPNAPKDKKDVPYSAECRAAGTDDCVEQAVADNGVYHIKGIAGGLVVFDMPNATLKAEDVVYDSNTGIATATGQVYYRDYDHDEVIYADSGTYNTDTEAGDFHHVRGYMKAKIVARPGVLTSKDPFYFEAEWVEKLPGKYLLHDAFITDCEMPNPWWTMHGSVIDFIPRDRAIVHDGVYRFRGLPVFFFPYFHKSLKTEPRRSGFLAPNIGHSSSRGFLFGLGYYQTIGRSMDATYVVQDFTSRGYAHHVDFRGRPTDKSYFNLIFYGVQDRGIMQSGALLKASGFTITGSGKIDLGHGWIARAAVDYLSSYLFHQQFSDSFSEAIFSETHSSGFLEKHFGTYTFDVAVSRTQSFQDTTPGNSITIRALPEVELNDTYQQLASGRIPLWFSLHASYGLFHRVEPQGAAATDFYETSQFSTRADIEPSLTSVIRLGGFSLLPEVTAHETFYGQTLVAGAVSGNNLFRSAPEAKLDLMFPTLARVYNHKTIFGDKLRHVIEPRVRYDYVTGVNSFQNTLLFDPTDLITNTRELEYELTNRIYARRGDTVTEIFSWDLRQKHYFDPTFGGALAPGQLNVLTSELSLTGYSFLDGARRDSPIVSTLRATPINGLTLAWQGDYDPVGHRIVNSMLSANIRFHRYFVNAGSDQIHPNADLANPANQFRTTFGYGDANRKGLNAAFSMVYDYRASLLEYGIAQVTYNTSCCGFSFQVRRLDFGTVVENQYLASFSIANVASVGTLKKQERIF